MPPIDPHALYPTGQQHRPSIFRPLQSSKPCRVQSVAGPDVNAIEVGTGCWPSHSDRPKRWRITSCFGARNFFITFFGVESKWYWKNHPSIPWKIPIRSRLFIRYFQTIQREICRVFPWLNLLIAMAQYVVCGLFMIFWCARTHKIPP